MPNPQPLEPTYNYLNADIAALSSVIAAGAGGANDEDFFLASVIYTDTNTTGFFDYNTAPPQKIKTVFRFGINIPKTYNLNGTEVLRIWEDTAQGECNIVKCLLTDIIETENIGNTCLNYISDIQNVCVGSTLLQVNVEITNITPGGQIALIVGFSYNVFYYDRTQELLNTLASEKTAQSIDAGVISIDAGIYNANTKLDDILTRTAPVGQSVTETIVTGPTITAVKILVNSLLHSGFSSNPILNTQYGIEVGGATAYCIVTHL